MISQEFCKYQENRFDSFCRKVIRNACMDNRKCRMKREKRFSSLEAMQVEALELERDRMNKEIKCILSEL